LKGDGSLYSRGGSWWFTYYVGPEDARTRVRRSLKTGNWEIALDRAKALRKKLDLGGAANSAKITVKDLVNELLVHLELKKISSLPKVKVHAKVLLKDMGHLRATELTTARVEAYQQERIRLGRKPATVRHETDLLRQAYRLAARRTPPRIERIPHIPSLTVQNARQGFFSWADFRALRAAITDEDLGDFLDWFWWTGMRPSEIRSMAWEMFDQETWTLQLDPKVDKIRKGRVLALTGPLRQIMERRLKRRRLDTPLIFHRISKGKRGQPVLDYRLAWKAALKEAGLATGLLPYDLRRSALRNMVRGGTDFTVAMKISGHRTRSTFDRYNITSTEDIAAAIKRTAAYVAKLPTNRNVEPIQKRTRK
jgi:integrase